MNIFENIINAFSTIISNKLRSGLTMLGIIIGVSSVIVMIAIGEGARKGVTSRLESLGANLLMIMPGGQSQSNVRGGAGGKSSTEGLTKNDIEAIASEVENLSGVSPEFSGRKQVIFGSSNVSTTVTGVVPDYETVRNFQVEYGQFVSQENNTNMDKVAVLGKAVAESLFDDQDPVGKDIKMEGNIFTVIGIMKEKGQSGFRNADDVIFIPLSTALKRVFGVDYVSIITVSVNEANNMEKAKADIELLLMQEHGIKNAEEADFTVLNQADAISTMNEVTQIFTLLLGGIAAISLLVGGIGVMNIMLVSVTERTREIGIRKSIGAKRKDILLQFLTEATFLSILGGMIGILISFLAITLIREKAGIETTMSANSILLAFLFSFFTGIFFGILPAHKASRLKPIDALRFE